MQLSEIGVFGLGTMGKNLAINIASHGFTVSVYNRTREKTTGLKEEIKDENILKNIHLTFTVEEFVQSLKPPRKILMMVSAGKVVDDVINELRPFIAKGDILIDGGNSHFLDTIRRSNLIEKEGFRYIGMGVSGGEEGALKGPSLMPGGNKEAYEIMEPLLLAISAKVDGTPCCAYIGPDGAGHYVKMIHNGIEYANMQLIAEAYSLLKNVLNCDYKELYSIFRDWNKGELNSYLIEITSDILAKHDELTGKPVLEVILDKAEQKGTGKWASQNAIDLGVYSPSIAEAVFSRYASAIKEERVIASKILDGPMIKRGVEEKSEFIEMLRQSLFSGIITVYAQGFSLLRTASKYYRWNLNLCDIAKIWRGGCIIRAQVLDKIMDAYQKNTDLVNLLLDPYFASIIGKYQTSWREIVSMAVKYGIAAPLLMSTLSYYDTYRSDFLPANLIQAQRDYFGAHTFYRIDKSGTFHIDWTKKGR
jgi:6-phosphogluconate dehydrogenase